MAAPSSTTEKTALNHANLLSAGGDFTKDDAIRFYVASQIRFSKIHAAEGRTVLASWDEKKAPPSHTPWPSAFETPVLKPRIAVNLLKSSADITLMAPITPQAVSRLSESRRHETMSRSDQIRTAEKPSRKGLSYDEQAPSRRAKKKRQVTQAEDATCDSDEEHTLRLAERREHKRLRRAVLKSRSESSHSDNSEDSSAKKKRKKPNKKLPKATPKIPAGLALMHGFASTSVGKNRLTLVPPVGSSGVFNRGKASTKFNIDERKRSQGKAGAVNSFSERQFLNHVPAGLSRRQKRSPSPSFSLSSHGRSDLPEQSGEASAKHRGRNSAKKRKVAERKVESKKGNEKPEIPRSPLASHSAFPSTDRPSPANVVESVVWDIENESCTLPSESGVPVADGERSKVTVVVLQVKDRSSGLIQHQASNISAAESHDMHRSVIQLESNPVIPVLHAQLERSVSVGPSGSTAAFIMDSKKRSSSLGPSESASQVILHALQKQDLATSSKYFPSAVPSYAVPDNIHEDPRPSENANERNHSAVLANPDAANLSVYPMERLRNNSAESSKAHPLAAPSVVPSSLNSLKQALHAFDAFDPSLRSSRRNLGSSVPNAEQSYDNIGYATPDSRPPASFERHGSQYLTEASSVLLYMEEYATPDALSDDCNLLGDSLGYIEPSDCVTCDPFALGFEDGMEESCIYQPDLFDHMNYSDYVDPLDDMQLASEGYQDSSAYWADDVLSTAQVQADEYDLVVLGSELDDSDRDFGYSRAFSAVGSDARPMSAEPESAQSLYCASSDHSHDHTDNDGESLGFEEPWLSQGATLLRGQGGLVARARGPLERNLPTVARVEQDVARTLRDHWHPQKL
ncbi:hypothetical protein EWM64_g3142 [Hericium alpestre]|uniref:Uncharacterized protein n=1 Tax=Hericium alpestre TaxID=135208 RepID=A0A4Z0A3H0_9AGAM|nr:hypothetical protein EWM64_g3142 [Hericium alpestre]